MIRIEDDILHFQQLELLDGLLYDRTTKHNIVWATDAHASLGPSFALDKEIHVNLITGDYSGVIRTRAAKAFGQQSDRIRQHGEVFTPLWICKKMNDYAYEMWFGYPDVFVKAQEGNHQYSIFELFGGMDALVATGDQPNCRIYDWRSKESVEYNGLKKGRNNV